MVQKNLGQMALRILVLAVSVFSSVGAAAVTSVELERYFSETLPLCEELVLPNSMARSPGTDINARLKSVEAQIKKRSEFFWSAEGLDFLQARFKSEQDPIVKACAKRLMDAFPR